MAGSRASTSKPPINLRVMKFCEKSEAKEEQLQKLLNLEDCLRFRELVSLLIIELTHQREMLNLFVEIIDDLHGYILTTTTYSCCVGDDCGTKKSMHEAFKEMFYMQEHAFTRTEEFSKKIKNLMGRHFMEDNELWENWKDFQDMKAMTLEREIDFSFLLADSVGPLMSKYDVGLVQKFEAMEEKIMSWVIDEQISKATNCFDNSLEGLNCIHTHVLMYMSISTKGTVLTLNCLRRINLDLADILELIFT